MVRKNLFDIVTLSGVRRDLLFYLDDGPKSLSAIREHLDITSPEVSPRIKELLEHQLIHYKDKSYHLTPMGKSIVKSYKPFINTINVFNQHPNWWEGHDLSAIPVDMLFRINEIQNYLIIEDDLDDDRRTSNQMFKIINNSNRLLGITCTFDNEYPELITNLAKNDIPIKLIITDKIYNLLINNYSGKLKQFLRYANCELYICKDDIKISQIVTDKCLFFSLSYNSGKFDYQSNLISDDLSSINWGVDLFEYYRLMSKKIDKL